MKDFRLTRGHQSRHSTRMKVSREFHALKAINLAINPTQLNPQANQPAAKEDDHGTNDPPLEWRDPYDAHSHGYTGHY